MKHGWRTTGGILHRGSPERDRRTTAVHEAGHAVVAHHLGARVLRLYLDPKEPRRGWSESAFQKQHGRIDPIVRAMVALSGHEAEHRIYGRPLRLMPAEDYMTVMKLGVTPSSANVIGWMTRRYVGWCESDIRRVARALRKRGRLNRRQFLAALRGQRF